VSIFGTFAPLYWAAGLPVIPLKPFDSPEKGAGKAPILTDWTKYGAQAPSSVEQDMWLRSYPNHNIGLPFGAASGLCAIDIDTEDEGLIKAIREILPPTPWTRIGAKGMGLIYKWSGQRNFKLRGEEGGMILEFLGMGNQMVVPPSIHPTTKRPYTADAPLYDVMDKIVGLPSDIDQQLRELLGTKGFSVSKGTRSGPVDVVPEGERDVQMVRHAGYLARVVLGIDKNSQFSLGEAIDQMTHWVRTYTATVSGDNMDPGKGVAKLLEFLVKDLEKGRSLPEGWDADLDETWEKNETILLIREKNKVSRWTLTKARDWLTGKIAERPHDDDWAMARVQELLQNVAKDDKFTEMDFRALVGYIQKTAGNEDLKFGKADLLQGYKSAKREAEGGEDWEDHETIARAVLEQIERVGELRFDKDRFWQWNGSCFKHMPHEELYMEIANNIKGSKLVQRHNDYSSVTKVLERMTRKPLIEAYETGINFANGWVGEDLVPVDHSPKYGATFTLPFEYRPELASRANRFFEFLTDCWGSETDFQDRVKALQEAFAASMFGVATDYQRAFLLVGKAGTGKTVMLDILGALVPPEAMCSLSPEHWSKQFAQISLIGKIINICPELPESGVIAGNTFKAVVEGSPQETEYKGRDRFLYRPMCAHWFGSNFMPISRDSSRGFTRRWLMLDFSNVIPKEQQIKKLAESIIADEREAIAAWAMEGLSRLRKQGDYTQPACHNRRMEQLRRINNSVKAFLDANTNIIMEEGSIVAARDLYDQYNFHQKDIGRGAPVTFERFIQMLEDLDLDVEMRPDGIGHRDWMVKGVKINYGKS
jgi:putative DNA primase/helicase